MIVQTEVQVRNCDDFHRRESAIMQEDIVGSVVTAMLPLGESPCKMEVLEAVRCFAAGGTNRAGARVKIREALQASGYQAGAGEEDSIKDLYSEARINLMLETAHGLANGARDFIQSNDPNVAEAFPAKELCRFESRDLPRDWPARWSAVGGALFPGKSDYPEGRMIALIDDLIWEKISQFGVPFPPFAFGSGMWVRSVSWSEAKELGLIVGGEEVKPVEFDFGRQNMQRLAANLGQRLSELEDGEQKRRADPLAYGTGDDLLASALQKLGLSLGWVASRLGNNGLLEVFEEDPKGGEGLTPQRIAEVRTLAERAIERGFGDKPERLAGAYRALARIYKAIKEPDRALLYEQQAALHQQEATRLRVDFLICRANSYDLIMTAEELLANTTQMAGEAQKQILGLVERAFEQGTGEKYNLRPKAHRILAEVCEQMGEPEKAEANRVKYLECADGVLLLRDAQAKMAGLGEKVEAEPCARILDMLTKAVPRLPADRPKLHAEAYRATAEVLEALGDAAHAIEYYECALQMDPKIAVGKRLNGLRKKIAAA